MVNHVKELQKLNHLHFLKVYVLQMNLFIPLCIYFYWALNLLKVILCFSCSSISHSWLVWSQIPLWWAFSVFFNPKAAVLKLLVTTVPFSYFLNLCECPWFKTEVTDIIHISRMLTNLSFKYLCFRMVIFALFNRRICNILLWLNEAKFTIR